MAKTKVKESSKHDSQKRIEVLQKSVQELNKEIQDMQCKSHI